MEVDVVDIEDEGNLLDQMGECSYAVESECKVLPLVFNQVHNDISLEHGQFIGVCRSFHDLAICFRHRRNDIKLVGNLEWLQLLSLFIAHLQISSKEFLVNIWVLVSQFEVGLVVRMKKLLGIVVSCGPFIIVEGVVKNLGLE